MLSKAECITMRLDGVHNTTTRREAAQVLRELPGVRSASVHGDVAQVTFLPDKTTVPQMTAALDRAGYSVI